MEVRMAKKEDIPDLIALLNQVGQVHHEIRPDLFRSGAQKYNETQLEDMLQDPKMPIYVATEEGKVLGYAFCQVKECKNDTVLTDRKEIYLDDLCVYAHCRGQHIGHTIFDYVCQAAREMGCQGLTLNVWNGNDSAMYFYQSCGLKPRKVCMEMDFE